jgi:hypothetical protein
LKCVPFKAREGKWVDVTDSMAVHNSVKDSLAGASDTIINLHNFKDDFIVSSWDSEGVNQVGCG